jgi:hypothetical protein
MAAEPQSRLDLRTSATANSRTPRSGAPSTARRPGSVDEHAHAEPVQYRDMSYETGRSTDVDPSNVMTRDDFAVFLSAVLTDFRSTGESEWENGTLDRFLDAFAAFADARIVNEPVRDQEEASWQLFAEIVRAATGYE